MLYRSLINRDTFPREMFYLKHLPTGVVSGGARGRDTYAREFAQKNNLPLQEFLPDYDKYGRGAPLVRNKLIVEACDCLITFWDGQSHGTKYTIDYAVQMGKPVKVVNCITGEEKRL
jgi:predicted Rossmann fold nucleotide-binding protein DprA/Smf involved in DNA uptake